MKVILFSFLVAFSTFSFASQEKINKALVESARKAVAKLSKMKGTKGGGATHEELLKQKDKKKNMYNMGYNTPMNIMPSHNPGISMINRPQMVQNFQCRANGWSAMGWGESPNRAWAMNMAMQQCQIRSQGSQCSITGCKPY